MSSMSPMSKVSTAEAMQLSLYFAGRQGLHPRFATAGSPILPIDDLQRHRVKHVSNTCQTSVVSSLQKQLVLSLLSPRPLIIKGWDWVNLLLDILSQSWVNLENSWDFFDNLIVSFACWRQLSRLSQALGILGIKLSLRSLSVVWSDPNVRSLERWPTKQRRNERNTHTHTGMFQGNYSKWASLSSSNHQPLCSWAQQSRSWDSCLMSHKGKMIYWIVYIYIYTHTLISSSAAGWVPCSDHGFKSNCCDETLS